MSNTYSQFRFLGVLIYANKSWAHHGLYGLGLIVLALCLSYVAPLWMFWLIWPVWFLGLAMVVDDWVQHILQVKNHGYHSPIHNLYVRYLREGLVIKVEKWLDNMGKDDA